MDRTDLTTATGESGPTGHTGDTGACAVVQGSGCGFDDPTTGPCAGTSEAEPGAPPPLDGEISGGGLCGCQLAVGPVPLVPGPLLVLVLAWWLRRSALLGLLLLLLTPGASLAQVDAQRVDLVDGGDFPVLWEGDLGVPWSVAASLSLNAAGNLAILEGVPEADVLIDQVWTWQPHLSANLGGVARVGATLPHHAVTFLGRRVDGLQRGDLGLWLSIPLTKEEAEAKAAWMVRVDVPTGPEELLLGDVGVVTGLYSTTFPAGPFEGTLNLGAAVQQAVALPGAVWGSHWVYGVGLRMEPAGPTWVTAELVGNAPVRFWGGAPAQYPLEAVLSGGAVASRTLSAGLGLGVGLTQGLGSSSFRLTGLVDVRPRQERDRDGDGIADLRDLCRREPEDRDGHRDRDGCPDLDNDRDGLPDLADVCPDLAEVFNQHEDSDGCPDRITRLEVAVLAVAGLEQATVTVGAGRPTTVFPGEVLTRRVDLDLVEIEVTAPDFLPHRAELTLAEGTIRHEVALAPVRYGQVEVRATSAGSEGSDVLDATVAVVGGPSAPTREGPLRLPAGPASLRVSATGHLPATLDVVVPVEERLVVPVALVPTTVTVADSRLRLGRDVGFAVDEDVLDADGQATVEALARWLRAHPEVVLLRVEGHADPVGTSAYNYALSVRRARVVLEALVAAGIAEERLQAIGSGEVRPRGAGLEDGDRRVEFVVLVWREGSRPDGAAPTLRRPSTD